MQNRSARRYGPEVPIEPQARQRAAPRAGLRLKWSRSYKRPVHPIGRSQPPREMG